MTRSSYALVAEEIRPYHTGTRTRSASLLGWFLTTVWRLDPGDVEDSICDGGGDKGIDALVVDDDTHEITIFQAKHRQKDGAGQGDSDLKALVGAAVLFETADAVGQLIRSAPNDELLHLLTRLDIREKVAEGAHARRLVFVTNGVLDRAGRDYVKGLAGRVPSLEVWDLQRLAAVAARTKRPELRPDAVRLRTVSPSTRLVLRPGVDMALAVVPAVDLVALPGIPDFTLFTRNVRLSLGRTRINRELGETVGNPAEHALFPAYHNGLTILTRKLHVSKDHLSLEGVAVVNGCQSLLALHRNRTSISDDLRLLVKVVQVPLESDLSDQITYRANNQNPVDIRDQRSTDAVQRDLQTQVHQLYPTLLAYRIREGEEFRDVPVLDNQLAAQLLMAVYLQEPWNAVRKVRLFDHDYRRIFGHEVDAPRLVLLHVIATALDSARADLSAELKSSFSSVRLTLAYLVGTLLRENAPGRGLLAEPERWLPVRQNAVLKALKAMASEVVDTVNYFVEQEREEKGADFDAKTVFKSLKGVRDVEREVKRYAKREPKLFFQVREAPST